MDKKRFYLSTASKILLISGLSIVLIYLVYIFISVLSLNSTSSLVLIHIFFPQLEHVLMSLTLIIIGALLLDVTAKELKKE